MIDKLASTKLKKHLIAKRIINRVKKPSMEWKKTTTHQMGKLMSRVSKVLQELNTTNPKLSNQEPIKATH